MTIDFHAEARALQAELVARRRDLHQHPELPFQEHRTARIVAETLTEYGLDVQTEIGKTGVVGILDGTDEGTTLLIRVDMDALPIEEANSVPYASTAPGIMHACGHDAHTAIGLAVAKILSQHRDRLTGRVKFAFQPAEEIGEGAQAMIADGVLEDPRPDATLGVHMWNDRPVGQVSVTPGPFMASNTRWTCHIRGVGGHGAQPHQTKDPIIAAAQIVNAIQTIVSRNINPLDMAVCTVGAMNSGDAFNVIPASATLKGTIRAYKKSVNDQVVDRLKTLCTGIAAALGCEAELIINASTIPVVNDEAVSKHADEAARQIVGDENITRDDRRVVSDDMAFLMDDIPGCYILIGSADKDGAHPHHHPQFDIDEEALVIGTAVLASAAGQYVLAEALCHSISKQ